MTPIYIEVQAEVRYWEDAIINGIEDIPGGVLTPLQNGDCWCPTIRLSDGVIMDWPAGTIADIHFKICDAGEYWLLDGEKKRMAKWGGFYVPNKFLCHGDNGYGDYIIMTIEADGRIDGWQKPDIEWAKDEEYRVSAWKLISKKGGDA